MTLTAASQVHIVEPQWNPAIEAQAIARAHRMGQTRPVTVIKYVAKKTVEKVCLFSDLALILRQVQQIMSLQDKKSFLARFSLGEASTDDAESSLDVSSCDLTLHSNRSNVC